MWKVVIYTRHIGMGSGGSSDHRIHCVEFDTEFGARACGRWLEQFRSDTNWVIIKDNEPTGE